MAAGGRRNASSNNKRRRNQEEAPAPAQIRRRDRLSALSDATLQRVLARLDSAESTRTSALSRRWHHVHGGVPVVDLVDPKTGSRGSWGDLQVCFDHQVTSAILCKSPGTPIRAFRLDACHPPHDLLEQWVGTAARSGLEEFDARLRYKDYSRRRLCPFGRAARAAADFDDSIRNGYTAAPRQILRCPTLRRLRLTNWSLFPLPAPSPALLLETLCLKRIMARDGALQQLLASCPNLADLTLEECPDATRIEVASANLRSFAMICCHNATGVILHTDRLRSLHYKGGLLPPPNNNNAPFFSLASYAGVASAKIEICEGLSGKGPREVAPVAALIGRCANLTHLHLSLRPSMAYYSSAFAPVLRRLPRLTQLGLQGSLPTDHAVHSVAALLHSTNGLRALSLFPLGPELPKKTNEYEDLSDDESDAKKLPEEDAREACGLMSDSLWKLQVKCLERKLRRINIVGFKGRQVEKKLAKFLLSRSGSLEGLSVTLAAPASQHRTLIARELRSWMTNRRAICNLS